MPGEPTSPQQASSRPRVGRSKSTTVGGEGGGHAAPEGASMDMDTENAVEDPQPGARPENASGQSGPTPVPPPPRARRRTLAEVPQAPMLLPARKVFPIQIGSELFRLSGASISSDGQSLPHLPLSRLIGKLLTVQEHPLISRSSLKSS